QPTAGRRTPGQGVAAALTRSGHGRRGAAPGSAQSGEIVPHVADGERGEDLAEDVEQRVDADQVDEHEQRSAGVAGGPDAEDELQDTEHETDPPPGLVD